MTIMRMLIALASLTIFSVLAVAQNAATPAPAPAQASAAAPVRVAPADAKNHIGDTATVCGKVVDTKVPKYGIAGHGKPVSFDLEQGEPNPIFYFVAFAPPPAGPEEVIAAYKDKRVCVTGKITHLPAGGAPFIMASDRAQIKPDDSAK